MVTVVGPELDRGLCIPNAASRVGVAPTYGALYGYINDSVRPDMTLDNALAILQKMGPVTIPFSTKIGENKIRDAVVIDTCLYPMNDVSVYIYYDEDTRKITTVAPYNED
jgi:hypothetical protein